MAFGRKKRRQQEEEERAAEASVDEASAGDDVALVDEGVVVVEDRTAVREPGEAGEPAPGLLPDVGPDLSEAAASAGDPAAAGIDAEGSGAPSPGAPSDTAEPAAYGHDSWSSGDDGVADRASAASAQAQSLVEARPELLVAGAFAAGLVAARVLGALGGRE